MSGRGTGERGGAVLRLSRGYFRYAMYRGIVVGRYRRARATNYIRDAAGNVVDASTIARVEAVVRESRRRLESSFEDASIGMALVGIDGRWLQVNRALCRIVGYPEEELLSKTFQDITHPEDLEADIGETRRLLAGEIAAYQMEKRYLHREGRVVWSLLDVALVRDADNGEPLYFIAQVQDVTERRKTEDELRRINHALEERVAELEVQRAAALRDGLNGNDRGVHEALTPRELDVLRLLPAGKTNRQIAEELRLSPWTVKGHVEGIIAKLEVCDRTQAAVKAVRLGLIDAAVG